MPPLPNEEDAGYSGEDNNPCCCQEWNHNPSVFHPKALGCQWDV